MVLDQAHTLPVAVRSDARPRLIAWFASALVFVMVAVLLTVTWVRPSFDERSAKCVSAGDVNGGPCEDVVNASEISLGGTFGAALVVSMAEYSILVRRAGIVPR